jgi:hypothetical protein
LYNGPIKATKGHYIMTNFIVETQILENYGSHEGEGTHAKGESYWKCKGGNTFLVHGCERSADAWAFVMAAFSENNIYFKEFPVSVTTFDEYLEETLGAMSDRTREFYESQIMVVSPDTRDVQTFSDWEEEMFKSEQLFNVNESDQLGLYK